MVSSRVNPFLLNIKPDKSNDNGPLPGPIVVL